MNFKVMSSLGSLFSVWLLERAAVIAAEQQLLLKITLISLKSRRDAFFSLAVLYSTPLV